MLIPFRQVLAGVWNFVPQQSVNIIMCYVKLVRRLEIVNSANPGEPVACLLAQTKSGFRAAVKYAIGHRRRRSPCLKYSAIVPKEPLIRY